MTEPSSSRGNAAAARALTRRQARATMPSRLAMPSVIPGTHIPRTPNAFTNGVASSGSRSRGYISGENQGSMNPWSSSPAGAG